MPHPWPFTGGLMRTLPAMLAGHGKIAHYAYDERGPVLIRETRKSELRIRKTA